MATTPVNWLKIRSDLDGVVQQEGTPADFRLRTGETFTLRARVRDGTDEALTAGLQQDTLTVTVLANRWETAAPPNRAPEKGDQITIAGKRHAIEDVRQRIAGSVPLTWTMRLKG